MPVTFECQSHWSNVDPGDDGWWWVYMLGEDRSDARDSPVYVGMTKHLRRRLAEHARYWTAPDGCAYVIAVNTDVDARRLEASLIGILEPPGNRANPHSSWLERQYLIGIQDDWVLGGLEVCDGCACLYQRDMPWATRTEPGDCDNHEHPKPEPLGRLDGVFDIFSALPSLRRPEEQPSGDLLEPVPTDAVPAEEEGQELIREAFVEGP